MGGPKLSVAEVGTTGTKCKAIYVQKRGDAVHAILYIPRLKSTVFLVVE
jgi:hypothetical protein